MRLRVIGVLLALWPMMAVGQQYYVTDTVTEHSNHGTFYHDRFEGRKTASGEVFDQNKFTAAHWKIKLGTMVMVTNHNTGKQVIVKVNDRCPKRNVLDMTRRAAYAVGIKGCQKVTVRILPDGYEERWLAQETMFDSVHSRLTSQRRTPAKKIETTPIASTTKTEVEKVATEKITPKKAQKKVSTTELYNVELASEITHAQAFDNIQKLPVVYREKVIVEPLDDSNYVRLILDVRLPKKKADDIVKAMKRTFPTIETTPYE